MTRRGATPFLQAQFRSSLRILGSKDPSQGAWEELAARNPLDATWEDWSWVFGGMSDMGYVRVRVEVCSIGKTGVEPYLDLSSFGGPEGSALVFGLALVSSDMRLRRFEKGELSLDPGGTQLIATGRVEFELRELTGSVELEPLVVVARMLAGPEGRESVTPGTIVGSSYKLELRERGAIGPLGDMFDYQWISFTSSPTHSTGELFDVDLQDPGDRPTLFLNKDIENFHHVMNIQDTAAGRPSEQLVARKTLDKTLASAIVVECLSTIVSRITSLADDRRSEDPENTEFGSIYDELSTHEQTLAQGWRHLLGKSFGHKTGYSVVEEIAMMDANEISKHLSSDMPRRVRSWIGVEDAVSDIIRKALQLPGPEEDQ